MTQQFIKMKYNLIKISDKGSIKNFPTRDDFQRWKDQRKTMSNDWKYNNLKENPIYFNNNSMGYRTYEFDFDNDNNYILALGCSNTYGLYLHEEERYSNLIEKTTGIKTYNIGICGGSASIILMNLTNLLYNCVKKPHTVIIQWPEYMRLNFPFTNPYVGIYNVRANSSYKSQDVIFEQLIKHGNTIETYSLWAKNTTVKILEFFNIKTITFAKDNDIAVFYNVPYIEQIDYAYDNKHIGTQTNKKITDYILERL